MKFNKTQVGLSIVELLVALLISLLLMTGVVQVFMASRQTYATNEAASRLQENGRFALEFIAQSARHAGYVSAANNTVDPLPRPIASDPAPLKDNCADICSTQGSNGESDTISFALEPRFLDGERRDCSGRRAGIDKNNLIINHFYIVYEGESNASLGCASRNITKASPITPKTPKPTSDNDSTVLIEGIDALQVQYGIGTTGNVSRYVSADRVGNEDWNNVLAVRIAVLANSITPVDPPPPADRQYVLLDAPPLAFNDGKARQIFTTTIKLRNIDEAR